MKESALDSVVEQLLSEAKINSVDEFIREANCRMKSDLASSLIIDKVVDQLNEFRHFHVELSEDGDQLIYRDQLFANTVFKVRLTAEEIRDKRMYIGHRLLPFINPAVEVAAISLFTPEGKLVPKGEAKMEFMDGMKYITLIAPYQAADYFRVKNNDLLLPYFDLEAWMKEVDYQQEDLLEWAPIDASKHQWRLEKLSLTDFNRARIKTNHKDVQLLDGIYDFLDNYMVAFPIDHMLFRVFANGPEHLLVEQGSPLGPLLTTQEDIQLYNNEFPFIHYVDFHQQVLADTMERLEEEELPEPGTSTHLDGIFLELQSSYSEIYIRAHLLNRILQEKDLSYQELLEDLFDEKEKFVNTAQATNFEQAIKGLFSTMKAAWKTRKLELPKISLLRKYLEVKREVFVSLDEMVEMEVAMGESNLEQIFFINSLNEQLDQTAQWLMDETSAGKLPIEEIRTLTKQFDTLLQQFRDNRSTLTDHISDD